MINKNELTKIIINKNELKKNKIKFKNLLFKFQIKQKLFIKTKYKMFLKFKIN